MNKKAIKELLRAFMYAGGDTCQKCDHLSTCSLEFVKGDEYFKEKEESYCMEGIKTYFEKRSK